MNFDEYIENAKPFARPILKHFRALIHQACPDVEESMKWSFPHFSYKGILCSMAAFKEHCSLGFWKAELMQDPHGILNTVGRTSMGHFGKLTDISELPSDEILLSYIHEAIKLNESGIKISKKPAVKNDKIIIPHELMDALKTNPQAHEAFQKFTPGKQKEYIEWIVDAKQASTKAKRLATAIEWISEGKSRNWKYESC